MPYPETIPSPGIFSLLHVVVRAAVRDEFIEFHEGALVEQRLNAFAGGHSAGLMLFFDFSGSAAEFSGFVFREEIFRILSLFIVLVVG